MPPPPPPARLAVAGRVASEAVARAVADGLEGLDPVDSAVRAAVEALVDSAVEAAASALPIEVTGPSRLPSVDSEAAEAAPSIAAPESPTSLAAEAAAFRTRRKSLNAAPVSPKSLAAAARKAAISRKIQEKLAARRGRPEPL